jgi:ataxia telangiectasia mutated family protein
MQQVFVLVNRLLQKEHTASKRKLNIRTYKVVPLSQRSGIVEWCEGTTPLGEYLVGPPGKPFQGAHSRYRPRDWGSLDCRKKLMDAGSKRGLSKLETYAGITRHFRPVFHHFFMERFPNPSEWFERRLMYTRSVATSSIVGYVVGLGDRHVHNILIDTNTAEFIHIDLGVAFEQGKTLPTPETVPFRLTRDVVDGMGVAGVEGVFRRCCEKTMEVMRSSHEELRTIVEVLLYDPLYMWTISPVKALNLQRRDESTSTGAMGDQIFEGGPVTGGGNNGSNPTNKMAERVLLRLQEKLEGIEDGVPLSVSGQVNQLIQEATDPSNLCLLFAGWQPWI